MSEDWEQKRDRGRAASRLAHALNDGDLSTELSMLGREAADYGASDEQVAWLEKASLRAEQLERQLLGECVQVFCAELPSWQQRPD